MEEKRTSHREIHGKLNELLNVNGLECHPFKVGWYNSHVKPGFQLEYDEDSLAFVVISTPSFFEKFFIPFVRQRADDNLNQDYLDQSISSCLKIALQSFVGHSIDVIHDFEMRPGSRRPKVLVQTAGHVSGAVYFYRKDDIPDPCPWPDDQAIYGVCLHPRYVGWFALRAVILFRTVLVPELPYNPPKDILENVDKKIELLNRYNKNWRDWSFRDIIEPYERYSDLQKRYFSTPPAERNGLIKHIRES